MGAMSGEKPQVTGGLSPQYHTYERQKCFIAYTEQAEWSDDLLSACQEVLSRPEFNLEPDYARKHFYPDVPLCQKALELIANARYGIYDLSYWRDEEGEWHLPCNVFIELGMAIALNRPTLLLRHANNRELDLPACLKSVSGHILEFSGQTTLKCVLQGRLPQWVNAPPERDWWNRHCIFGGRVCEYREAHPRAKQWGEKTLHCHISDGPDVDRDDFRGVVEEVLGRFSDVTFDYLGALPITKGYDFLLCTHCQTVRSTPFAIYRITSQTLAETFIAIGMGIALEKQFEYRIPKILLTEDVQDVPSLLSGYEVVVARSDKDRKTHLRTFMPTVMQKVRETTWKPRPLPFIETSVQPDIETIPLLAEEVLVSVRIDRFIGERVRQLWQNARYETIALRLDLQLPGVATVRANPEWLWRALEILIDNAVDAVADCDVREITVSTREAGAGVDIIVSDTGPGIPEEVQAEIGRQRIEKPKDAKRLGMGLTDSQTIVKTYGGGIRVEPSGPTGTTMVIWLPAEAKESSRASILLADNDSAFLATQKEFLEAEGYEVIAAASTTEARAILRQERIDLAVLDLRLTDDDDIEDVSGLEVARDVAFREVPKIIISSFPTYESVREALGPIIGRTQLALDFVAKQEGPEAMLKAIEMALSTELEGIRVDETNGQVWVEGRRVALTSSEFHVLLHLYNHLGRLCTHRSIVEEGLKDVYLRHLEDESRISKMISRLRKKIEPDPDHPRYIITVRGQGYMLRP
jgi:DNA-binding response OmpR family regulator